MPSMVDASSGVARVDGTLALGGTFSRVLDARRVTVYIIHVSVGWDDRWENHGDLLVLITPNEREQRSECSRIRYPTRCTIRQ